MGTWARRYQHPLWARTEGDKGRKEEMGRAEMSWLVGSRVFRILSAAADHDTRTHTHIPHNLATDDQPFPRPDNLHETDPKRRSASIKPELKRNGSPSFLSNTSFRPLPFSNTSFNPNNLLSQTSSRQLQQLLIFTVIYSTRYILHSAQQGSYLHVPW